MSQPSLSDVHIQQALNNICIAYVQSADNFAYKRILPAISVAKETDKYFIFTKNDFLRDEAELRAPGDPAAFVGIGNSTATYSCNEYALAKKLPKRIMNEADPELHLDKAVIQALTQMLMIRMEQVFVGNMFTTSKWATDNTLAAADKWDKAASDPIGDVSTGMTTVLKSTGFEPNAMLAGYEVHQKLKAHPVIVDRCKYMGGVNLATAPKNVAAQALAQLFEVDEYIVAKSNYATNDEGATAAYDFNLGKHALLMYKNPAPSILMPSAAYMFNCSSYGGNAEGIRVRKYYDEPSDSDVIEVGFCSDLKVVSSDCGYFFSAAVA